MSKFAAAVALALSFVLTAAQAKQPPKPPELDKLKDAVGTWEATVKMPDAEIKGTSVWKMDLGGLWLVEDVTMDFGGAKMEGRGMTTYDPAKKKYVMIWIDSMSTDHMVAEGEFDKAGKVLTMSGEMPSPDGKKMKVKMITEQVDKDKRTMSMRGPGPDGKEMEMMKITYTRKK